MVVLGFIFAAASLPSGAWAYFGVMAALAWAAAAVSGVGLRRVFLRSLVALPFALIALPIVFAKPGDPLYDLPIGPFTLTATAEGLEFFASVLIRSWTSVTAAALLTATTPPLRLLAALRGLRLPEILVAIVMLMYRYLFVLVDEALRMLRARSARSASVGPGAGGSLIWRAKVAGGMGGSLLLRTLDRSDRVYMAMLARGYDGKIRLQGDAPLTRGGLLQMALPLALFAGVALTARLAA